VTAWWAGTFPRALAQKQLFQHRPARGGVRRTTAHTMMAGTTEFGGPMPGGVLRHPGWQAARAAIRAHSTSRGRGRLRRARSRRGEHPPGGSDAVLRCLLEPQHRGSSGPRAARQLR